MSNPILTIEMEKGDKIIVELFKNLMPEQVNYFLSYVNSGYYDGLPFHSCLKDQFVQCGFSEQSGYGSPAFVFEEDDIPLDQDIKNQEGTFAIVTSKYPNTAILQFAILLTDKPIYNEGIEIIFSPLGKVIDGLNFVKKLSAVEVDEILNPIVPQMVNKITVEDNLRINI